MSRQPEIVREEVLALRCSDHAAAIQSLDGAALVLIFGCFRLVSRHGGRSEPNAAKG